MNTQRTQTMHNKTQTGRTLAALAALGALALLGHPAQAAVTLTAQDSTAQAGGTGFFDVTLFDDQTGSAVNPASFSFELAVDPASGITFTGADMTTANTYLFNNNSFDVNYNQPFSTLNNTSTDITANDDAASGSTTVSPGQTFGLGHISYSVAPGTTAGPFAVSFQDVNSGGGGTSLAGTKSDSIDVTPVNGTITVTPALSAAPEPSEFAALGALALGLGGLALRARRRSHAG